MARLARPICLFLAVLLFGPMLQSAVAQQPACGQVVTQNVVLEQDMRCPDTTGLVVGADGVTINLNGHEIDQGIGFRGEGVAIDDSGGHDGVTVRNGSVGADGEAIRLIGASGTRLIDVSSSGGISGASIEGGGGNHIVRGNIGGLGVAGSDFLHITDSTVSSAEVGIQLTASSAVIRHNTVPSGILVAGNDNRVIDNVVVGAFNLGIEILRGANNVVARNWVVNTQSADPTDDRSGDGIHVFAFTAGTVVRRNIAVGNGDDGIDLDSSSARVAHNVANDNADLGIDALPGTSAAGNLASGNGDPAQCVGISCG